MGIHTHRGVKNYYNSGLYFSDEMISVIKEYERELSSLTSKKRQCRIVYSMEKDASGSVDSECEAFYEEMNREIEESLNLYVLDLVSENCGEE